jgi:hypothetical protein
MGVSFLAIVYIIGNKAESQEKCGNSYNSDFNPVEHEGAKKRNNLRKFEENYEPDGPPPKKKGGWFAS